MVLVRSLTPVGIRTPIEQPLGATEFCFRHDLYLAVVALMIAARPAGLSVTARPAGALGSRSGTVTRDEPSAYILLAAATGYTPGNSCTWSESASGRVPATVTGTLARLVRSTSAATLASRNWPPTLVTAKVVVIGLPARE